jgi:O-antigen/teichoic acid export membrane protein
LATVSVPPRAAGASRVKVGAVMARNTLWNYAGFVINMATGFILFPFVVGHLGEAAAGIWLLLSAVTGYMGLMELGIVPALTQRVAAAIGRGDDDAVRRASSSSLALMLVMMGVAAQAAWFAPWLADVLELPPELDRSAAMAIAVAIVGVALRMPLAPFQALLLGCQRQDRCSQLWIVMALVKAALTAALVAAGYGFVAIVVMEAMVHLLAGILQVRWVHEELPHLSLAMSAASWDEVRYLTSFGLQVTVTGVFVLIVEQTDRLVIGAFRPIEEVTLFSAAWKLYVLAYAIPTTMVQALTPIVANLHGGGDEGRLRAVFVQMSKYAAAVAFPLIFAIGIAGGWFLDLWMGPRFVGVLPVLQLLLLSLAVTSVNHPGYSVIVGTRSVGRQMWTYNAPLAVLNLGISVWLVHRLGILGVALGTAIPSVLLEYRFLALVTSLVGMTVGQFLRLVLRPTLLPAVVSFLPAFAVAALVPAESPALPAVALGCGVVFGAWFWRRGMSHEERASVLRLSPWLPTKLSTWLERPSRRTEFGDA